MLVGLVDSSDIIDVNPSVTIFVKLGECLHDNLLSGWVHWSSDSSDELIVGDGATSINIEVGEDDSEFLLVESEHEISACLGELVLVKRFGVIIIHDLELSLETDETSGTSLGELLLHDLSKNLWVSASRSTWAS